MEHKQTEPIILSTDESQGIVEAIWAVMGNIDGGGDVIHPGAFTKTFKERGSQVKLLDNHRTDSVMSALGTVLELKELPKGELPPSLLEKYPDASGGAWGKFQFLMKTPEGKGAFDRIESKAVGSWSFGYDTVLRDHSSVEKDSRKVTVRNLRELKLYEISCVLFPMNEATTTTTVKSDDSKELVNGKPVRRLGDVLQGSLHKLCTMMCDEWYIQGYLDRTQHATVMAVIDTAANTVANGVPAEIADFSPQGYGYYYDCMSKVILSEVKAGRVLSSRNATRIQAALDALHETLKEAGVYDPDEGENEKDGWLCDACYKGLGREYECFTDPIFPGKCAYCGNKEIKHHLVKLPNKNGATEPQKSNALTSDSEAEPLQDESTRQIIELELEALKLLEV